MLKTHMKKTPHTWDGCQGLEINEDNHQKRRGEIEQHNASTTIISSWTAHNTWSEEIA
jgi:hypothetical protein